MISRLETDEMVWPEDAWKLVVKTLDEPQLTRLGAKALYATGMVRHLLEGAGRCLEDWEVKGSGPMEMAAFVLVADAVELLGRCLAESAHCQPGCRFKKGAQRALRSGAALSGDAAKLSANDLWRLRNFTTHGAANQEGSAPVVAVADSLRKITEDLISAMATALSDYGRELEKDNQVRANLAQARIEPLRVSGDAYLHIQGMLREHASDLGGGLLHDATWRRVGGS